LILKEYMSRLASDLGVSEEDVYPADHFDLIGGVGFGGCVFSSYIELNQILTGATSLVAVMLGLLRMSVNQAIEEAIVIAAAIFRSGSQGVVDQAENSHRLKQVIQGLILAEGPPLDVKMYEPSRPISNCRVLVHSSRFPLFGLNLY
jgi:hypothetical protein